MTTLKQSDLWLGLPSTAWAGVGAIATVVAVLVAIGGALLVLRQLKQTAALAEEQARPYLVPLFEEVEIDWALKNFVIRNVGSTAARDVTVTIEPPYVQSWDMGDGMRFMDAAFLNRSTAVLSPDAELRTFFDSHRKMVEAEGEAGVAQPFSVRLRYRDRLGNPIEEAFEMDPREMLGIVRTEVYGLHHLAQSVRAIAKAQGINSF